jgi:hypothetical protein
MYLNCEVFSYNMPDRTIKCERIYSFLCTCMFKILPAGRDNGYNIHFEVKDDDHMHVNSHYFTCGTDQLCSMFKRNNYIIYATYY